MDYRIIIIGSSCSGKTTLGQKLSIALGLPVVDLDDLFWKPNWTESKDEEFFPKIEKFVSEHNKWVISGNYTRTHHITHTLASHMIFLDLPYYKLLYRLVCRTFNTAWRKTPICNGNTQSISAGLKLFVWQIKSFKKKKWMYDNLKNNPYNPETKFLRFSKVRDVQTVIDAL